METLKHAETLDDGGGSGEPETLPLSTPASGGGGEFAAGDLVWAKAKSQPWWPGRVVSTSPASGGSHRKKSAPPPPPDVHVAHFGGGGDGCGGAVRCRAAQVRGFLASGPDEMARQSRAKGFVTAVEEALDHVGRVLEAELTCGCVPPEAHPLAPEGGASVRLGIVNFSPLEFLSCIRDVALDVSVSDLVQCARLKSWVLAFGKNWEDGEPGYNPRHAVEELIDKVDLDLLTGDPGNNKVDANENVDIEADWIAEHGVQNGLQVPEEKLYPNQKKRSMAALMEELDSEAAENDKDKEAKGEGNAGLEGDKESESGKKDLEADSMSGRTGEELGFIKRERKKSKYLSPPYTNLTGLLASLVLPKGAEAKITRKSLDVSQDFGTDLAKMVKCDGEKLLVDEEEKKGSSINFGAASVEEIVSMLCCTARDVFHLKRNRSGKVVKSFAALYRSSMFVNGTNHETYKSHICAAAKLTKEQVKDKFDVVKFEVNLETGLVKADAKACVKSGLVADLSTLSEPAKAGWKRNRKSNGDGGEKSAGKKKKEKVNVVNPLGPGLASAGSVPIKQANAGGMRSQAEARGGGKTAQTGGGEKDKGGINVEILPVLASPNSVVVFEQVKTVQDSNQVNDGSVKETPVNVGDPLADQSSKKNARGRKKVKKAETNTEATTNMENMIVDVPVRSEHLPMDGKTDGANGEAAAGSGKVSFNLPESARMEMLERVEMVNGKSIVGISHGLKDQSQKGKSRQKKKTTDGASASSAVPDLVGKICNGRNPNGPNSTLKKKKKKAGQHFGNPAALLLDFTKGVVLPTKEELLSAFRKFGFLIESKTDVAKDTHSARVVFAKSAEAEAAYNSAETLGMFGPPFATPRLHYLPPIKLSSPPSRAPASKPPLTDIRKNLEKMISSLSGPSSLKKAAYSDGSKTGAENLVGEMQGLLAKVDKMLNGPATSTPP